MNLRGITLILAGLFFLEASGQELPPYVDNSQNKYFPPIIDQSGGSCAQASSIGYVFTYEMNRLLDRDASLPENRFSYQYVWNLVNDGIDQGGFAEDGLFVVMRSGAMSEANFSTLMTSAFTWPSGYEKYHDALRYRVSKFVKFESDVDLMKAYLAGDGTSPGGILSFSGHCWGWDMQSSYSGPSGTGYKALVTSLPTSGAHAMTIVGYDDLVSYTDSYGETHTGAFIVANSWGLYSHDRGRYYYPYHFFSDSTVPNQTLSDNVITAEVKYQEPQVLFKLTLQYTSRDDLAYHTGVTNVVPAGKPLSYNLQSGLSNKGGDHYMRGTYDKEPLEFALDLTDYLPSGEEDICRYFLKIVRSAKGKTMGEGRLLALSVIDYRSGTPIEYKYRGALPVALDKAENLFVIGLVPRFTIPCSPVRRSDDPLSITTAAGDEASVIISKKGINGHIKYSIAK